VAVSGSDSSQRSQLQIFFYTSKSCVVLYLFGIVVLVEIIDNPGRKQRVNRKNMA
jgi:hypothetical protein